MTDDDGTVAPGDLVLVKFGPARGSEQDGRRPALVISTPEMHAFTRRAIVCPITSNVGPWPTKVFLPDGLAAHGAILSDQVRSIDRRERIVERLGPAPLAVVASVREKVAALIGVDFELEGSQDV